MFFPLGTHARAHTHAPFLRGAGDTVEILLGEEKLKFINQEVLYLSILGLNDVLESHFFCLAEIP